MTIQVMGDLQGRYILFFYVHSFMNNLCNIANIPLNHI
jgi:hypothetical protein